MQTTISMGGQLLARLLGYDRDGYLYKGQLSK